MRTFKRPLTLHQSDACTNATKPRCTCRCGGLLHGVDHMEYMNIEKQLMERSNGGITEDQVADIIAFLRGEV